MGKKKKEEVGQKAVVFLFYPAPPQRKVNSLSSW
jgi:hypothetical protein